MNLFHLFLHNGNKFCIYTVGNIMPMSFMSCAPELVVSGQMTFLYQYKRALYTRYKLFIGLHYWALFTV